MPVISTVVSNAVSRNLFIRWEDSKADRTPVPGMNKNLNILLKSKWRAAVMTVGLIWLSTYVCAVCVRKSTVQGPSPPAAAKIKGRAEQEPNQQGLNCARLGYNDAGLTYFSMDTSGNEFSATANPAYLIATNNKATLESMIAQGTQIAEQRKIHLQKASRYIDEDLKKASFWRGSPGCGLPKTRILDVLKHNAQSVDLQLKLDL